MDDAARLRLRELLLEAQTDGDLADIAAYLLNRYVTSREASTALWEAMLDGRRPTGRPRQDGVRAELKTSPAQRAEIDRVATAESMSASDVVARAARRAVDRPPPPDDAAYLEGRYGRGTEYATGKTLTWRRGDQIGEDLTSAADGAGVSVSVLLRWALDQ